MFVCVWECTCNSYTCLCRCAHFTQMWVWRPEVSSIGLHRIFWNRFSSLSLELTCEVVCSVSVRVLLCLELKCAWPGLAFMWVLEILAQYSTHWALSLAPHICFYCLFYFPPSLLSCLATSGYLWLAWSSLCSFVTCSMRYSGESVGTRTICGW